MCYPFKGARDWPTLHFHVVRALIQPISVTGHARTHAHIHFCWCVFFYRLNTRVYLCLEVIFSFIMYLYANRRHTHIAYTQTFEIHTQTFTYPGRRLNKQATAARRVRGTFWATLFIPAPFTHIWRNDIRHARVSVCMHA